MQQPTQKPTSGTHVLLETTCWVCFAGGKPFASSECTGVGCLYESLYMCVAVFFCACRSYPTKNVSSPFLGEAGRKTAAIPTGVLPRGQGDRNTLAHYPAIPRGSTRGTATCGHHHLQECLGRSWHARSQLCLTGKFRSETDGPYRNTNIMMNSCWALLAAG